jgi:hypothetical protein
MKFRFKVCFLMVWLTQMTQAQINAVTSEGDKVILYSNGTWKYEKEDTAKTVVIRTNKKKFEKEKDAGFQITSKKINIGVWINPKEWNFEKSTGDDASEFNFEKKGEDLFAMLITERTAMPLLTLKDMAIRNAKKAALDVKLINEEYRNVNGIDVLMLQMAGTIQGVKFTYLGYYYTSAGGSSQFVTYTASNLFEHYKSDMEELLNGLEEIKKQNGN